MILMPDIITRLRHFSVFFRHFSLSSSILQFNIFFGRHLITYISAISLSFSYLSSFSWIFIDTLSSSFHFRHNSFSSSGCFHFFTS